MTTTTKRGWLIAAGGTALGAALAGAILFSNALAVHGSPFPFELDGDITNNGGNSLDDWQNVFGLDNVVPPATDTPVAGNGETFVHDLPAGNAKETQYDAGKDTLDVTAWTRKDVAKVTPDKDNITDAFAKVYMVDHDSNPATPAHRVIYFGMDRLANNGDAALGFWFFQKKVTLTGTNGFSPGHTARNDATGQRGDILVQLDVINGGAQSRIEVFEWVGSGGDTGGTLQLLRAQLSNGTTVCTTDDAACGTSNTSEVGSYWPYVPKFGSSGKLPSQSLFEGGIDITKLVGDVCFNSFLANTRTAHSETADLKDLALGDFNTCGSIDLVRKICQSNSTFKSPSFDYTTGLYQTLHEMTINNDGLGGDVFDVGIRDDSVGDHATCSIVAINGGTGNPSIPTGGIPIPNNTTFIKVADTLAAGVANQMSVKVLCQADTNSFHNAASVRAGQVDNGTSLTDSYTETDANNDVKPQCTVSFSPAIEVTKSCDDVTLDATQGFAPLVCSTITLTNKDPDQRLTVSKFIDTHLDGTTKDLLPLAFPGTTPRVLQPSGKSGDTVTVLSPDTCYYPTKPDNNQTDPDKVTYTDQASAETTGQADGTANDTSDSQNCALCPTGLDGAPPKL